MTAWATRARRREGEGMSYLEPPEPREHDSRCASLCDCQRHLDQPSRQPCYWNHIRRECTCADLAEADAEAMADIRIEESYEEKYP